MTNRRGVTGDQIRAARALLNLSAAKLAEKTGLSRGTIQRAELEIADVTASNMQRIVETLESLNVIFIPENGQGAGVRMAKRRPKNKSSA